MEPKELKKDVFTHTSIEHLNLPSVVRIENYSFCRSKLKSLKVENCKLIEEQAFMNENNVVY